MFIQMRSMKVEKGHSEKVVERFSQNAPIDTMPGLIDRIVSVNKRAKDYEEVMVIVRWESIEAWKNWEKSDVHIQGHRTKREKPKYILDVSVNMYEVKAIKEGLNKKDDQ